VPMCWLLKFSCFRSLPPRELRTLDFGLSGGQVFGSVYNLGMSSRWLRQGASGYALLGQVDGTKSPFFHSKVHSAACSCIVCSYVQLLKLIVFMATAPTRAEDS
jgi:hypothetical protein